MHWQQACFVFKSLHLHLVISKGSVYLEGLEISVLITVSYNIVVFSFQV